MGEARTYVDNTWTAAPGLISQADLDRAKVLQSWKEIAVYLNRGVRTVQRWHCDLQLPVYKIRSTARSPVFAFTAELDGWLRRRANKPSG